MIFGEEVVPFMGTRDTITFNPTTPIILKLLKFKVVR
jgi:hypothetical protein